MVLKQGSDLLQLHVRHAVRKDDSMGIPHGNTGHPVLLILDIDRLVNDILSVRQHRNPGWLQNRASHIDADSCRNTSVRRTFSLHGQLQIFYTARADDTDSVGIGQPLIIHKFGDAADAVSAHLRPRTVRVIHLHLKIGFLRRVDKDHTVPANAEMSVA